MKNKLDSLFFTRLFVPRTSQISSYPTRETAFAAFSCGFSNVNVLGMEIKMKKGWKVIGIALGLLSIFMVVVCIWYVNDFYHSDGSIQELLRENEQVKAVEIEEGIFLDGPGGDDAVIFYPGAKVEFTSYLPLLYKLAEKGIDCFLIKMPCNLAFLGKNRAKNIINEYDYKHWYLSGHSLGGAMAAAYAADNIEKLSGLVLLAAYPTESLKSEDFTVLSIYGSRDGILNMKKLEKGRELMPDNYSEICIEGGNHAWFGNYGEQKGDKTAAISRKEQQNQTVQAILQMVKKHLGKEQEDTAMTYQQISAQEAKSMMEENKDVFILDVRTREEYETGHIKGAICFPNEEILEAEEELPDKGQTILVYCRSGNRSKQAAQKLAEMGYKKVLEFGGILDWPYQELVE